MHRFGSFEFDAESGELRRNGMLVKLAAQPAGILRLLIEARGEIVARETIRQAVWGDDTHVDFDRGLTVAIAQIRSAISDSAESPRYIQTVPRKGYRFLSETESPPRPRRAWLIPVALAAVIFAAFAARNLGHDPDKVIAVLPFQSIGDGVPAVLPAAVTDEVISQLGQSGIPRLSVLARGSTAKLSFDEARTRVAADYIVEGTVRRTEGGLRANARLAEAATAKTLWAKTIERAGDAGFDETAAAEISSGVAKMLGGASALTTDSCGADWEKLRTARALLLAPKRQDLDRAIEMLDGLACRAAQTALADALLHRGRIGKRDDAGMERAGKLAAGVLAQSPDDPEANNVMGGVLFWKDWRFAEAKAHYERALRRNPSLAAAHHDFAWLLVATGETGEAINHLRRAVALDPLSPRINIDAGWLYLQAHRFREAAVQAERALQLDASLREADACRGRALFYLGEKPRPVAPLLASAFGRAQYQALADQPNEAIASLEEAFAKRELMFPFIGSDPAFRKLAADPRFQALKAKLKLR